MTTFTSDDREEAYKKILEEASEPIPFVGWVNTSPLHIVDSGASVMKDEPVFWTCGLEEDEAVSNAIKIELKLEYYNIPLYTHPAKTLTDEEINDLIVNKVTDADMIREALRKAQEK
jgi:hypothetical protein